jgi:hypothetical protein
MEDINKILENITEFGGRGGYTDIQDERSRLDGWYTSEELRIIADTMDKLKTKK